MNKNDVVKFHTPMADENPADRYLLLDDPAEAIAHAEKVNKIYPKCPMTASVRIEFLGKLVDGKLVPTDMFLRPISTVKPTDLATDPRLVYEQRGPNFAIRTIG